MIGRLADTLGQRRVLLPVVAVFVASGLAFLTAVHRQWPHGTLFVAAGAAGACIPPVSSIIRVRWTHLLRGSTRLPVALAMESVVDEFVFIVGPVLVTFLSTTGHATTGVVTASPSPPSAACCSPRRPAPSRLPAGTRAAAAPRRCGRRAWGCCCGCRPSTRRARRWPGWASRNAQTTPSRSCLTGMLRAGCLVLVTPALRLHRRSAVDLLRTASALCPGR